MKPLRAWAVALGAGAVLSADPSPQPRPALLAPPSEAAPRAGVPGRDNAFGVEGAGPELRWFLDDRLAAAGEEPLEVTRVKIVRALQERLPPGEARGAEALLGRYLALRGAISELEGSLAPGDLEGRLAAVSALRRRYLGEGPARAMFGDEEAADAAAIARQRLTAVDPLARAAQEEAIEAALPSGLRAQRGKALGPLRLHLEEEAMRAQGATAEDLHQVRVASSGEAAAARLDALDAERRSFQDRFRAYREAGAALQGEGARQALRARSFTPEEQLRVEALERLQAEGGPR